MAETVDENGAVSEEEPFDFAGPDWYLQSLVDIVNSTEMSFPITLSVRGLVVSGLMVSGHKYFDGLTTQLQEFLNLPSDHTTVKHFTETPREGYLKRREPTAPPPVYIHLQDAKVFAPGQKPMPNPGAWWRGRLSSVDGFHFGKLNVSE